MRFSARVAVYVALIAGEREHRAAGEGVPVHRRDGGHGERDEPPVERLETVRDERRAALIGVLHGVALRWLYSTDERSEREITDLAGQVATWLRAGLLQGG
mgnify:CR=1 FL=1